METQYYNANGYLELVSAGGATRWTVIGMNALGQVTGGTYGSSLNAAFGYDNYGFPTSSVTGSIQNMQYNFITSSSNLNWRKDMLHGELQEQARQVELKQGPRKVIKGYRQVK